jgi:cytochrome o ubiquinol oxidase subunit 3
MLAMQRKNLKATIAGWPSPACSAWLPVELYEFLHLIHEGAGRSAARSCLVLRAGRHPRPARDLRYRLAGDADVPAGQARPDPENNRRLMCLSMFWHFLDVVWIGVFTFVYLMGVLP